MPKTIELSGKRFGELVVVRQNGKFGNHKLWLCQCDCGNTKLSIGRNLTKGYTKSCGCRKTRSRAVDIGQKYNRLTAIERSGSLGGEPAFKFKCDCGVEKIIIAQAVRRGLVKSCGCFRKEHCAEITKLGPGRDGKAYVRAFFKEYKHRAKTHGIGFSLTLDEFEVLIHSPCAYGGHAPAPRNRSRYGSYAVSGIDRKDSGGPYSAENCVPCCTTCNIGKNSLTVDEFKKWISEVYHHFAV